MAFPKDSTLSVTAPSGLNLRPAPSADALPLKATMPVGATVIASGASTNGFAEVSFQGVIGWASEQWLSAIDQSPVLAAGQYALTGSDVALRSVPVISQPPYGGGSNAIDMLAKGTIVNASGANRNGFAQVEVNNKIGWVSTRFLGPVGPQTGIHADGNAGVGLPGIATLPTPTPAPTPAALPPATGPNVAVDEAPGVLGTTSPWIGLIVLVIAAYYVAK